MLQKGCCELRSKKIHALLKASVLLISVVGILCEETKGPRWQVNEHPPVVPLIPREQEGEFTSKLLNCN